MARIRTIKPEFPQSESMGRISRDARLLFIMLWTICDDSGRSRANSRMLASLLFPYDDDANKHMSKWLDELESERCIVRYQVDNQSYLEICNWLNHQKIDKPTASKIPPFAEDSPRIREDSRIVAVGMEGNGMDQGMEGKGNVAKKSATVSQVDFLMEIGISKYHAEAWIAIRKKKRLGEVNQIVMDAVFRESAKHGITVIDAIRICCERSWGTFDASWMNNGNKSKSVQDARLAVADQIFGRSRNGTNNTIIDVEPIGQVPSDGTGLPKAIAGLREPDVIEMAGN